MLQGVEEHKLKYNSQLDEHQMLLSKMEET